jgi:hypothetical protein
VLAQTPLIFFRLIFNISSTFFRGRQTEDWLPIYAKLNHCVTVKGIHLPRWIDFFRLKIYISRSFYSRAFKTTIISNCLSRLFKVSTKYSKYEFKLTQTLLNISKYPLTKFIFQRCN